MDDFEKAPTGDARWPAQWPAVPVLELACALGGGTTAARANRAQAWGRGPLPSMRDHLKRFCAPESTLVVPLPGRPLVG